LGETEGFSSKIWYKARMLTLTTSTGGPNVSNETRKANRGTKARKKVVKFVLFIDDMILYIENSR
jgi:hypothetical protein